MAYNEDITFVEALRRDLGNIEIVDIGCGRDKFPGAVGVDIVNHPGIVDIVHNLDKTPWPLNDNRFDIAICSHLIEHVDDFVLFVEEIHRILKPGGLVIARTPHYSHVDSYVDPTHRRHLTTESFNYFIDGCSETGLYSDVKFIQEEISLSFGSGLFSAVGKLLYKMSLRQYEKYWCRLFPATTLYYRLRSIK